MVVSQQTYAIELYFDEVASQKVRQLWSQVGAIASSMAKRVHSQPHLSLAVLPNADLQLLPSVLAEVAAHHSSFEIQFSSLGLFSTGGGVVFLAPVVTTQLLELHQTVHRQLHKIGSDAVAYYRPEAWVPHCTLARELSPPEVLRAVEVVRNSNPFFKANVCALGLVEAPPVRQICCCPLLSDSDRP
ncbi:hypothetical protein AY600_07100 [Phormidium willei BDU 130791]|nr:hypothetical protein AY600_07100 [Phormidium willei BDU 130791]